MVNIPKTRNTYCRKCKKHTPHKVSQYKTGKASLSAQGKRRYDKKQAGFGGQTKPVFHKKAKTTKKHLGSESCVPTARSDFWARCWDLSISRMTKLRLLPGLVVSQTGAAHPERADMPSVLR
ncbi:rpl36a [Symbiodinium sp. CCMP2456]|nr:rpl36a [Symbiodinium sp. CCMP2456]